jgi:hypothetical protein
MWGLSLLIYANKPETLLSNDVHILYVVKIVSPGIEMYSRYFDSVVKYL